VDYFVDYVSNQELSSDIHIEPNPSANESKRVESARVPLSLRTSCSEQQTAIYVQVDRSLERG
jgi:hypothetical protein